MDPQGPHPARRLGRPGPADQGRGGRAARCGDRGRQRQTRLPEPGDEILNVG